MKKSGIMSALLVIGSCIALGACGTEEVDIPYEEEYYGYDDYYSDDEYDTGEVNVAEILPDELKGGWRLIDSWTDSEEVEELAPAGYMCELDINNDASYALYIDYDMETSDRTYGDLKVSEEGDIYFDINYEYPNTDAVEADPDYYENVALRNITYTIYEIDSEDHLHIVVSYSVQSHELGTREFVFERF